MGYLALGNLDQAEEQFKGYRHRSQKRDELCGLDTLLNSDGTTRSGAQRSCLWRYRRKRTPFPLSIFSEPIFFLAEGNKNTYQTEMKEGKEMIPGVKLESVLSIPAVKDTIKISEERNLMVLYTKRLV